MNEYTTINWPTVKLGAICLKITDGTHKTPTYVSKGIPFISVKDIYNDSIHFSKCKYISTTEHKELSKRCNPEKGDVLITKSGTIGRLAIVEKDITFSLFVSVALLKPKKEIILSRFLKYALQNHVKNIDISQIIKGGVLKNYHIEDIKSTEIRLPPLPEQKKIVEKIEELFSGLESGIAELKKVKEQIKVYRQAVLKYAFEGKLTNSEHLPYKQGVGHLNPIQVRKGNLKAAEPTVEYGKENLPEGWRLQTLKELTTVLGDGLHGTPKYEANGDFYFINGNNLADGKIILKDNTKRLNLSEYNKYKKPLDEKTVLVSINGTLGNVAFYNNEKVVLGKSACYFNLKEGINKNYIRYFITSNQFLNYANKTATGSTIKNVSLKAMRELEIPLPATYGQQTQIVEEIEKRFSEADNLEKAVDEGLAKAESLRQSILKKAFEGQLL